jgi:uncharacterized SAM-binding protein YcdF (DUF218 family)
MVCGILLMMILYSIAVFWMNGNIEFVYYAGYASAMYLLFYLKGIIFTMTPSSSIIFLKAISTSSYKA